jgi:diguanylate cyclase (GGDEF)-like protein
VRRLSLIDELTGLHNRRGFFMMAEKSMKLAKRIGTPCSLLFIDLDGLKQVNDTLGHEAGDALLVDAALVLKQTFRESDVVARLGGDEFAVFAANCEGSNKAILNRLQSNVEMFNATHQRDYPLSMSVGIEPLQPQSQMSLERLLARADEAMYMSKRAKRCVDFRDCHPSRTWLECVVPPLSCSA